MNKYVNIAGIVGNPSFYGKGFREYTPDTFSKMKQYGFDTVFVNIAWSRPDIDVVIPEHIAVSERFPLISPPDAEERFCLFRERACNAKAAGMKTFALFGIPEYREYDKLPPEYSVLKGASQSPIAPFASITCISRPEVLDLYAELFTQILTRVPELDGLLVYNYDELADVCDEDSDCPYCRGIPAEKRIPKFLNALYARIKNIKPDIELWWEPWELSAAQVYMTMKELDTSIGIACHSTINEVYFINEGDTWLRITAAMAKEQGRKFIAEVFIGGSGEDLGIVAGYPCPRLVYRQMLALGNTPGICGIKEYFGNAVPYFSVNEAVFAACNRTDVFPEYETMIGKIASAYTDSTSPLIKFWELTSNAIEMIPWEISWVMRLSNYLIYLPDYWGKISFANLMRTPWDSPSWLSSRRSYYIITSNTANYNHRLATDLCTRFDLAIEYIDEALNIYGKWGIRPEYEAEFSRQKEGLEIIRCQLLCRRNHLMLSECADYIRQGKSLPYDVETILKEELVNLAEFDKIIRNSTVPYKGDYSYLNKAKELVSECLADYQSSIYVWINKYHF